MDDASRAVLNEFVIEAREHLDQVESILVAWEQTQGESVSLDPVFRALHTIKGSCGWLGFPGLEALAHGAEDLLEALAAGRGEKATGLDALLSAMGELRAGVDHLEEHGEAPTQDWSALVNAMRTLAGAKGGASEVSPAAANPAHDEENPDDLLERETGGDASRSLSEAAGPRGPTTVRVDVRILDRLMNQVGELVLVRNQITQALDDAQRANLLAAAQRLNGVTTELQEGVMKTRMRPVGSIWNGLPRLVRELARDLGKNVRLELEGYETELDRSLLEAVKDPLTHLVRNAAGHGIETPEARAARGKPEEARIDVRAFHEGGQVNIEVSDDGQGLDVAAIRQTAVKRGILGSEEAGQLSDRESFELIFEPGFSTTHEVTNLSGRGVGMDVVRTNIERIGGTVDVRSSAGAGTTFRLKIPLTLAIIPGLVVRAAGHRYAIPQSSVVELVRVEASDEARLGERIESIFGARVYRLRGDLLPLVFLTELLELPTREVGERDVHIVVLEAGEKKFGLVVDGVQDTEEIVVKPLGQELRGLWAFAGATVMGDGKVALILDIAGIARHTRMLRDDQDLRRSAVTTEETHQEAGARDVVLIVRHGHGGRLAIPLDAVSRLEEFPRERIERSGDREVIQYRGGILPLIRMDDVLGERRQRPRDDGEAPEDRSVVSVVVHGDEEGTVGFIVGDIIDIFEEELEISRAATREGVLGSAVIQGLVTELLDMDRARELIA